MVQFLEISGSNYTWDDYNENLKILTVYDNDMTMQEILNPFIKVVQELSAKNEELFAELNNLQAQISGSSDFSTLKSSVTGT